jgi:hypothetical protein
MRRPVSTPLVSSWNVTTIAYAVQNDRRVTSRVRSTPRSSRTVAATAAAAASR